MARNFGSKGWSIESGVLRSTLKGFKLSDAKIHF